MEIKTPYYEDMSRISNSNIGWFITNGPAYLHNMLTQKITNTSTSAMEYGTLIHARILQRDEFWNLYRYYDGIKPSSAQQELFCNNLANTVEIEPNTAILSAYRNAYSTEGQSDAKVLEKGLKLAEEYASYIEDIKACDSRNKITPYILQKCKTVEDNIQNHKLAKDLLYSTSDENCTVHNEFHINWEFPKSYFDYIVPCKSLIDRWIVDYKSKTIKLIDIKTTANAYGFNESIEKYKYNRQLAYYWCAIFWYMKNEKLIDVLKDDEWKFETYIVAIQSSDNTVRVFEIEASIIENQIDIINKAIQEIAWHMKNNLWDHTRIYYEGNGAEQIETFRAA